MHTIVAALDAVGVTHRDTELDLAVEGAAELRVIRDAES